MRKRLAIVVVSLIAAGSLAACGSSGGSTSTSTSTGTANGNIGGTGATGNSGQALTDVTVGVVPYSPDAIIWYAIKSGIFKRHGLNVTTKDAASPIATAAAMASGNEQFGFTTDPVLINATIQGAGMKCVSPVAGQMSPKAPEALLASKKSGITSLKGFQGKTIAQVQLGSLNRLATQVLLKRAGVTDVKYVAIPFPQMPQALASGRVDGAAIVVPFLDAALQSGARKIVRENAKLYAGGTTLCFAATNKYLASHAKIAGEFQAGMKEAILYAKDHMPEVLQTLVKHMHLSSEAASKQKVATNFKPVLNVASIGKIEQQMKEFGWITKTVDPKTLVWSPSS